MYGCCYGPFNLRNEIDRHNSTVGGHGSNTHFVTGDGGFINSFVSGFGGLLLGRSQQALVLAKPTLPDRATGLRFRGLAYLNGRFDYEVNATSISFNLHKALLVEDSGGGAALCLTEATGAMHQVPVAHPTAFVTAKLSFPVQLGACQP
jgi:hypothetical protein